MNEPVLAGAEVGQAGGGVVGAADEALAFAPARVPPPPEPVPEPRDNLTSQVPGQVG